MDHRRIERLIADLDDGRFAVRDRATRELAELGELAEPALRRALAGGASPEARRRLNALLDRLGGRGLAAETVRQIRAVEALELIASAEAFRLLEQLAAAPIPLRLTVEARAAMRRLARRAAGTRR